MTMQLFSFGHPCEHQLRRTCIGGSSCPLNGYPDIWCCSYIKGKINFKRDKPCEGPRCRWGFTHPTQSQFDSVTQVLNESRPIAAKMDEEADDKELLSFHMDTAHIVDTVQCTLHMMRHPPSTCARRVGQLLAFAAVKAGDSKVFMQLLKTMKKPVDSYILGAYTYITQGTPPTPSQAAITAAAAATTGKGGKKAAAATQSAKEKKETVLEDLRNDLVDIMNAALSQGGHLVDREDQHLLQATFLVALRHYPKSNRKRQEMLEAAVQKYGNRQVPPKEPSSKPVAPASQPPSTAAAGGDSNNNNNSSRSSSKAEVPSTAASTTQNQSEATLTVAAAWNGQTTAAAAATAQEAAATNATTAKVVSSAASTASSAVAPQQAQAAAPPKQPTIGISRVIAVSRNNIANNPSAFPRPYDPIRTDKPLPDILILGGMFNLAVNTTRPAPLGAATRLQTVNTNIAVNTAAAAQPKNVLVDAAVPTAAAEGGNPTVSSNIFMDSIFGNLSTEPVFDGLDDNVQLFRDFDLTWAN